MSKYGGLESIFCIKKEKAGVSPCLQYSETLGGFGT